MKYDEIISHLGDFGPYQRRIYLLLSFPIFCSAWHLLVQVFLAGGSDHWCAESDWANTDCPFDWNTTAVECEEIKKYASIPVSSDGSFSKCTKYNVSGLTFDSNGYDGSANETIACDEGWIYDRSQYKTTIITDFDLVCDRKSLPEIAQAVNFAGIMVGSFVLGILADKIGRFYTLYISIISASLFGTLTVFSNSFWMYTTLRFFVGAANYGCITIAFVAATELIGPSKRVFAGVAIQLFFALGFMALAGLGSLIRKWRYLQLTISLVPLLNLLSMPFIPESPRWLLSQNKTTEAMKIIKKISDVNGVPLPKHDDITDDDDDVTVQYTTLDLLRRPILTVRLLTMMFVWFVHTMVYYGLALSAADFGVNIYLSFFLAGLVELPAYTITGFSMELIGRRLATFILMMIGGSMCVLMPFTPLGVIRTCIAMVGKFGVSASFALVYVWAVEIFPTPLRGNSLGLCTLASQSGGIFSPLIILLGAHWAPFPFVVFGGLTIMAGFMALLLPETKGQLMPETIADAEALGRQVHISADFKRFLIVFFS
ncbi:putative organic cation transporter protein-like [Apostichopus japonicus]|uniref:Putative organic cation transporter protein-like n=1 Tax=Stichopus japonicus TaxID=307972 RepID=A0A2G8K7C0_STIJA|nr:putative organic cation transporter protein-like [Apostichopus japonicus]